jgi:F0F1-type ATP synthase assembly protein I
VIQQRDDRSSFALAMAWTQWITAIALEMAIPGAIGLWLDRRLETGGVFLVLGVVIGFAVGMWHLIGLTRPPRNDGKASSPREK